MTTIFLLVILLKKFSCQIFALFDPNQAQCVFHLPLQYILLLALYETSVNFDLPTGPIA